ncbi:unnamed protein product [Meganyctiphanes norvegica]|uniref:Copine-3 n=1 Tax=Meganyctiphanes norvegica TaxID=48144 RepID=A0AAV2R211_MEGNR
MNPPGSQGMAPYAMPKTTVEITVAAKNLRDRDLMSKSDPVCVLFVKELGHPDFCEIGRTEQIKNSLNPQWITKFTMEYRFEERQLLRFSVFDWDNEKTQTKHQDSLGSIEASLGEIMASMGSNGYNATLGKGSGSLEVTAREVSSSREVLTLNLIGNNLDKKDFMGKSDPFLIFYRTNQNGTHTSVHKTEVIKNTLNPVWKPVVIKVGDLSSSVNSTPASSSEELIKIECYDWDGDGSNDFIGECYTSFKQLLQEGGTSKTYPLINSKKKKKKSYKNSGELIVKGAGIHIEKTFLDYISDGVQIHFTLAVDFTASNGNPQSQSSLHFRHPGVDNQYSLAIKAVGEIILDYDTDKMIPALGFGGRVPPHGEVSHEFFLNGSVDNPHCHGVHGILEAYGRALSTVQLYGPTNFCPVINHVARIASSNQDKRNYYVLLIITDGIITDIPETKAALVNASLLPLSVIIIGVGKADFSQMNILDGDENRLSAQGRYAARDIVQFVELQKFIASNGMYSRELLAQNVLKEIPSQFLAYMKMVS